MLSNMIKYFAIVQLLDLGTLTALEDYLTEVFEGCLVVVSHDNFFVNRVAEHLFVFQGDGVVRDFQGCYDDYLEYRRESKKLLTRENANGPRGRDHAITADMMASSPSL